MTFLSGMDLTQLKAIHVLSYKNEPQKKIIY